jgi:hypothetical protein
MEERPLATCFVAYPSKPRSIAETIEAAIDMINDTQLVKLVGWRSLPVTGRVVIKQVCAAIDKSDLFICDMTILNPNVLFELGYAIAKKKRIWITLDTSYQSAVDNYKQVKMLTVLGYAEYHNASEIYTKFLAEQPYSDPNQTLYADVIEPSLLRKSGPPSLVYMKSAVNTEASARLTRRLQKSTIRLVMDDPSEVVVQNLAWYAENVIAAHAVISHLLDENRSENLFIQNAKYSFVSGLALGLGKPLLMLAHSPYDPPFDYQHLLRVHNSAAECIQIAHDWLSPLEEEYEAALKKYAESQRNAGAALVLQRIHLGDQFAENEQRELLDYFIVTAPYTEAIHTTQSLIYVGRKGSGKSANLYKIASELGRSRKNHVCIVKPVDYDVEGIFALLKLSIPRSEHGFMIESLWKYLIYTQMAISVRDEINNRPSHIPFEAEERDFLAFIGSNLELIQPDFTVRMENAIRNLCEIDLSETSTAQRTRISEVLHTRMLATLRKHLGQVLHEKQKVFVLIDNLDKAWEPRQDLSILSDFIFRLLSVSRAISDEFHRSGPQWQDVNVTLIIFLRSDIFSYIISQAREADKLIFSTIRWDDPRLLQRVIEERFINSLEGQITPDKVWTDYFTSSVRGIETREYIAQHIIPRPRDMINFCKASLAQSINRGHTRIEEQDILFAEQEYSQYAYLTLVTETKPIFPDIENLLYEFAGSTELVTIDSVTEFVRKAGINPENVPYLVQLLAESLFLGLETEPDQFRFLYDESKKKVVRSLARATALSTGRERFKINVPFHSYLEIVRDQFADSS